MTSDLDLSVVGRGRIPPEALMVDTWSARDRMYRRRGTVVTIAVALEVG